MGSAKTDRFKEHVQAIVKQTTGQKISKADAWELFKNIINGTVEFTLNQEDLKLPLSGLGKFEILKTKPRKSKAGLDADGNPDPNLKPWPFVPRFRFYPSVSIDRDVEHFFGLGDHNIKREHYGIFKEDYNNEAPLDDTSADEVATEDEQSDVEFEMDEFDFDSVDEI